MAANILKDSRWANTFIPTITHALYVSREPFVDFTSESTDFLSTVQNVFNLSFPNIEYELTLDDLIVKTVCPKL